MFNKSLISKKNKKILKSVVNPKKKYNTSSQRGQIHPYHLVDVSPWPIVTSFSALFFMTSVAFYSHYFENGFDRVIIALIMVIVAAAIWWRDVVREATFEGLHTFYVIVGLKNGMVLFIVSEVMLFFAFFWGFFHASLNPTLEIGSVWPPIGIEPMNTWGIPLLNTCILLTSGATVTWAHYGLVAGYRKQVILGLIYTVVLATVFTIFQGYEYVHATFTISDSSYGSCFYMATGLHGFHVLVGTLFLGVCFFRHLSFHFTRSHHLGFECAIWYWHFVDVVWIFLFISIYWWGSGELVDQLPEQLKIKLVTYY